MLLLANTQSQHISRHTRPLHKANLPKTLLFSQHGGDSKIRQVKRNGYDTLQIWVINANRETIDIVSEELA